MTRDQLPLDIVLDYPASVAIVRTAAQRAGQDAVLNALAEAEQAGLAAGLQRLNELGGYTSTRRGSYARAHLPVHAEIHSDLTSGSLSCSHAHVLVLPRTPDGAPVHLPAVQQAAAAAQTTAVRAVAEVLEQAGLNTVTAATPTGREIQAAADAAAQIPRRLTCPAADPRARQLQPATRWSTAQAS